MTTRSWRRLLVASALLPIGLSVGCGDDGPPGRSAMIVQTLAATPPIVRPGCRVRVAATLSETLAEDTLSVSWSTDGGAVLSSSATGAEVRAPELEELRRLPSGFTVEARFDAGERGRSVAQVGVVVDRRLGAPCED